MRVLKKSKTKAELWKNEDQFRAVADGAPIMLWMSDANGKVIFHNRQWLDFTGLSEDRITGESWVERLHTEDRLPCKNKFIAALREQQEFQLEYRLRRFDDEYRWIIDQGVPRISPDGAFLGHIGSCADITERKKAEASLRFATFAMDQAADCIYWIMPDGHFFYVNNAACEMLGYTQEELLSMKVSDIDPLVSETIWKEYWEKIKSDKKFFAETCHRAKDGQIIPIEVRANYLQFEGGEYNYATVRDISERKEAERNLNIYRQILEASRDFWSFADKNYVYQYANDTYSNAFEKPKEDIIGHTMAEVFGNEFFNNVQKKHFDECISGKHVEFEAFIDLPGFGSRHFFVKNNPVYDSDGNISGVGINAHDITEQNKVEEALRQSRRILSTLMDNLPGMVYRCKNDKNWTMEFMSEGTLDLTGYPAAEFTSGRIQYAQIIHPDDQQHVWDKVQAALQMHQSYEIEYRIRHPDETEYWVWERGRGIFDNDGQLEALEGFITDITDRKHAEGLLYNAHAELERRVKERTDELKAANKILQNEIIHREKVEAELLQAKEIAESANMSKSRFLANMSHELRTPLNAIIGYSELLKETAENEQRQQDLIDLENINNASKHLLSIINDILDLAKIEAGRIELAPVQFDVPALLDAVISSVKPLIKRNGNTLAVQCGETVKSMFADESRLRQCLLNLLSNAAKFTESGRIILAVRRDQRDGDEWINFRVDDTGIGMSTDQLAKVMQPFAQADASTTRKYGGTGLGLAITCELVGMMGGQISVESMPGAGSSFTLSFPMAVVPMPKENRNLE